MKCEERLKHRREQYRLRWNRETVEGRQMRLEQQREYDRRKRAEWHWNKDKIYYDKDEKGTREQDVMRQNHQEVIVKHSRKYFN